MWTTFLPILPTPVNTSAHVFSNMDTSVGAGVVRVETNILAVLIRVETLKAAVCVVAVRKEIRECPTFTAEIVSCILGAGLTRWDATELMTRLGIIGIIISTMTFKIFIHAQVTTSIYLTSVIVKGGRSFLVIWSKILVTVSDDSEGQHQHQYH